MLFLFVVVVAAISTWTGVVVVSKRIPARPFVVVCGWLASGWQGRSGNSGWVTGDSRLFSFLPALRGCLLCGPIANSLPPTLPSAPEQANQQQLTRLPSTTQHTLPTTSASRLDNLNFRLPYRLRTYIHTYILTYIHTYYPSLNPPSPDPFVNIHHHTQPTTAPISSTIQR